MKRAALYSAALGLALSACGIYDRYQDEVNAGPVDPVNFPPEELGAGGNRLRQGQGVFTAVHAYAGGNSIEYFPFSFNKTQLADDPLAVNVGGQPNPDYATPKAYVFDPSSPNPLPATPGCVANANPPDDLSGIPTTEQGTIFTALPSSPYSAGVPASTSYVPIVAEVPVQSKGELCQSLKSETTLLASANASVASAPDGKFIAFAIIDPGAAVYHADPYPPVASPPAPTPTGGLGLQHWGWYQKYLLAYLNGGYIPLAADGHMVAQRLLIPASVDDGTGKGTATPGARGKGYDVLEFNRMDPAYSPICHVVVYSTPAAPVTADALPKSATDIDALPGVTFKDGSPAYVFCLQLL